MDGERYANIRESLGNLVRRRVVDVTQHDMDEWEESQAAYFALLFDDGSVLKVFVEDLGFQIFGPGEYDNSGDDDAWLDPLEDLP